ncbi:MAG: lipase family protein [Gemmataceae bacterium]|nr:lipase family protein [Gemmataceae bacterium]
MPIPECPPGDTRLAYYFAQAVDLAYYNDDGPAKFRDQLGLEAKLISVGNTQVYVAGDDANIVCAFRGSESPTSIDGLKDWFLTNANNLLVLPEGRAGTDFAAAGVGARFHRGFLEALESVWAPFLAAVEAAYTQKERPIWICGHSLGGALALLAAWRLERAGFPVHQVYTFGAPMIGNAAAAAAFEKNLGGRVFRVIDIKDVVPKLPTISLTSNLYEHCPKELTVGQGTPAALAADLAPGDTIAPEAAPGVWAAVLGQIEAHFMNNYLSRLSQG